MRKSRIAIELALRPSLSAKQRTGDSVYVLPLLTSSLTRSGGREAYDVRYFHRGGYRDGVFAYVRKRGTVFGFVDSH